MSAIDSMFPGTASASSYSANSDRMNDLTMGDFIKMMVAELENQDPMNPMNNTEMLQQISQMRSITSNDRLTTSIESLTVGQALSTASSLIGKTVTGTNTLNQPVTGKVDKVTIENGEAKLYVGYSIISVGNVTSIEDTPNEE
jgi:flagellar basal-body rod modification protein FlgD